MPIYAIWAFVSVANLITGLGEMPISSIMIIIMSLSFATCDEITTYARLDNELSYKITLRANWRF